MQVELRENVRLMADLYAGTKKADHPYNEVKFIFDRWRWVPCCSPCACCSARLPPASEGVVLGAVQRSRDGLLGAGWHQLFAAKALTGLLRGILLQDTHP